MQQIFLTDMLGYIAAVAMSRAQRIQRQQSGRSTDQHINQIVSDKQRAAIMERLRSDQVSSAWFQLST